MKILSLLLLIGVLVTSTWADDKIMIADFEGDTYGDGWITTGTAFGTGPAKGSFEGQHHLDGFEGKGLVNTYLNRDKSTGTLTSPEFTIERKYINFLISGGTYGWHALRMNLLVNGDVVRTETGQNRDPLNASFWDVAEFKGQKAKIEIIDNNKGRWGHINIDTIYQSNEPSCQKFKMTLKPEKKYLNLPVKNGVAKRPIYLLKNGKLDYYFVIELANPGEADFWVQMDISRYKGQEITLEMVPIKSDNDKIFEQLFQSDQPKNFASFYKEKYRPLFHFTSQRGWLNDGNGLFYYKGKYHMFYQHNPYGWNWGNMHWGHAVSTDLVHWTELGDTLFPDEMGTIWSGSAVVDWNNTSGLKDGEDPPILMFYTSGGTCAPVLVENTQAIAYSDDGGVTFNKFSGNPVVDQIADFNRDPKVIWHPQSKKWIMALYLANNDFCLLASSNLKDWEKIYDITIEGARECPDFFPLAVDGDKENMKWVFWEANSIYVIGSFDGTTFTPETQPQKFCDAGTAYAGQTYSAVPESDGRRILLSWLKTLIPGMPFNQQMAFPVELSLRETKNGLKLFAWPVREIENLYRKTHVIENKPLSEPMNYLCATKGDAFDISCQLEVGNAVEVEFDINGIKFVYNCKTALLEALKKKIELQPVDGKLNLRILLDKASIEFFAAEGLVYIPYGKLNESGASELKVSADGEGASIIKMEINELSSIWK